MSFIVTIYQQQPRWAMWDPRKCLVLAPHLRENLREPRPGVCCCIGPEDSGNLQHTEGQSVTTEITAAGVMLMKFIFCCLV